MRRFILFFILTSTILLGSCHGQENLKNIKTQILNTNAYEVTMKQDLLCIMMAYPGYIINVEKNQDGKVYLIMKSGNKIIYDDGKQKTFNAKLQNPDIQDMFEEPYPLTGIKGVMPDNVDPGRFRVYPLLKEVYGGTKGGVEKNLTTVSAGGSLRFNKNNGASEALKNVYRELVPLARSRKDIGACVYPNSGTFNYRVISGTNLLSPHSFGIAIDLARDKRDYWQWASRKQGDERIKSYPCEIPQIFEKYGFVWGGKWSHFDILHYEYRPEIILKAKYFPGKLDLASPWYGEVPMDETAKGYVEMIDRVTG